MTVTWEARGARVGDKLPPLALGPITRTTLALFAGGSGDHNPIHLDLDVARRAGLDDVFAHGMLSMAYLGRLLTDHAPQAALREFGTRFVAITPVNAEPTCHGEVTRVEDGLVTVDLRVELADGTVTLTGQAVFSMEGAKS
ncbi:acyl dehydratase [Thermocatellispora tengchongensis]|uniref:Acyl dehydratase n=1 Tax=Thermocatellispora tengchongensis TaxID=1073253 RepID=A0A840P906_9ACTN|nr:MaoC/PaaZ C-terminal domain-containing protein [Thermocatellispora tengchongensis]MBB5135479.1 acyl dehydratase [Thermocatellispora tengchongensis]